MVDIENDVQTGGGNGGKKKPKRCLGHYIAEHRQWSIRNQKMPAPQKIPAFIIYGTRLAR
jgi:hypothetical protein